MCAVWHTSDMKAKSGGVSDVERWFGEQLVALWPVALGSLSLRRSPCIRPHCHTCETGEQPVSYVLYGRHKGRRFARYVPDGLAPEVRKALENGRRLQELLYEAGQRYLLALKQSKTSTR
jgi:hypothetical protein